MTWQQVHARTAALREVADVADRRRDGTLPWDVAAPTGAFADADELLRALLARWSTTLLARLDDVVERSDGAQCDDVARLLAQLAAEQPGVSAVLAAHLEHPAVAGGWRRVAAQVGLATGLPMQVELAGQLRGVVARTVTPARRERRIGDAVRQARRAVRCPYARVGRAA